MAEKTIYEYYARKDVYGRYVIDTFISFLKEAPQGGILNITSQPEQQYKIGLGGLGKTHEAWNMLEYFEEEQADNKSRAMNVIDLSAGKDVFGILKEVVANLKAQIRKAHIQDGKFLPFKNFEKLLTQPETENEIISNTLSKLAWQYFQEDLDALSEQWRPGPAPALLFFDSLDWLVDEELLKTRKTSFVQFKLEDLRKKEPDKDSIFGWLAGEGGLFDRLLSKPVSLVVSGRYALADIACNSNSNIVGEKVVKTVELGAFQPEDLALYIKGKLKIEALPKEAPPERLEELLQVSRYKPVLAVAAADLIINQIRKQQEETIEEKLWSPIREIIAEFPEDKRHPELWKVLNEQLFELTGSYDSSRIVWGASLAFYGLDEAMASELIFKENLSVAIQNLGKLSFVKSYPYQKAGEKQEVEFIRPHDDILVDFHEQFWNEDLELKNTWYQRVLKYYESLDSWSKKVGQKENKDAFRKQVELYYLTYLFEAADASFEEEEVKKNLEKATRYAQFIFIENIDQHPDQAERILSRVEIYLPFDREFFVREVPSSPFKEWMALRRIEYWLTERTPATEDKAEKLLNELKESLPGNPYIPLTDKEKLLAIVKGYWGELFIWRNEFGRARSYLDQAAREISLLGEENLFVWIRHLQGFVNNRSADFARSVLFNKAALEASLPYLYAKADWYSWRTAPEKTLFAQDERESYRFRRLIRIFLRSVGNLAAIWRYSGEQFLSMKYSFDQIYLWSSVPHADREIARAYANLLIAVHTIELDELEKGLGVYTGSGWLEEFEKDRLIKLRLLYAESTRMFKKGGLGFINVYLSKGYGEEVRRQIYDDEERRNEIESALERAEDGIQRRTDALGNPLPINELLVEEQLKIKRPDSRETMLPLPREIADLYYLKGKIHTQRWKNDSIDYTGAAIAFENAWLVAQKSGFRYLELKALEALASLSRIMEDDAAFEKWKAAFETLKEENIPEYHDVLAKYYNTLGNRSFQEAIKLGFKNKEDAENKIKEAFGHYCKMLDASLRHNQDRYEIAQKVIASRIGDLARNNFLQTFIYGIQKDFREKLKTTDADKKDPWLSKFVEVLFGAAELLSGHLDEKEEESQLGNLDYHQRLFAQQDMARKSLEVVRLVKDHYLKKAVSTKQIGDIEKTILAYYRFAYLFQHISQNKKVKGVARDARRFLNLFPQAPDEFRHLEAVLEIVEATTLCQTNEFWITERFLSGEQKYYTDRHPEFRKLEPAEKFRSAIKVLASFCAGKPAEEITPFVSILSDGCYRLGEFILLTGNSVPEPEITETIPEEDRAVFEILDKVFHSERVRKRIGEGSSPYLEYAREFAALTHDIQRQVEALQSIYNYWYLRPSRYGEARQEDRQRLMYTVKAYCLDFVALVELFKESIRDETGENSPVLSGGEPEKEIWELERQLRERFDTMLKGRKGLEEWYKGLDTDLERFHLKEKFSKYVRFLPKLRDHLFGRHEFESPFIFAKLKLVMGNEIFSRYFEPDDEVYQEISAAVKQLGQEEQISQEDKEPVGRLLLEKFRLKENVKPLLEGADSQAAGKAFWQSLHDHLEKMENLPPGLYDSLEFNDYLRAVQHRVLQLSEEKTTSRQFGKDMRQMFLHYLEGLDVLATDLRDSAEFYHYILEIQRRILLMPKKQAIREILVNLEVGWNQFPGLRKRPEVYQEIAWTLKSRYIALCLLEI